MLWEMEQPHLITIIMKTTVPALIGDHA